MDEKNKSDGLSGLEIAQLEEVLDLLHEKLQEFDVAAIRDEQHLRTSIMNRVLDAAMEFFAVAASVGDAPGGKPIRLIDMPEETRMEHLNRLMLQVLDKMDGPGPALRRSIARLILDYRLLLRLRETLTTLPPLSTQHKRVLKSIQHVETKLSTGMLLLFAWPLLKDDKRKKEWNELRNKVLQSVLENPEAFMHKEE
jgi:hypothetical protein